MSEFDKWYSEKGEKLHIYRHEKWIAKHGFEAGQQSQQSKIDELQRKIAFQEKAIKNIKLQFENKQIDCDRSDRKIDELQARVDEALRFYNEAKSPHNIGMIQMAILLKGNKDEN